MWSETFETWFRWAFWWLPKSPDVPGSHHAHQRDEPVSVSAEVDAEAGTFRPSAAPGPTPAAVQVPPPPAKATPAAPPARAEKSAEDDLTLIKGIGPTTKGRLLDAGFRSFADLAACDPEHIVDLLKGHQPISKSRVEAWKEHALELTRPH